MMGAQLNLSSQEDLGSVFSFTIPLKEGSYASVIECDFGAYQQKLDISVLLVEDNQANQFIAKSFIEKWGVRLNIANNGKEAIEMVSSKDFDIVLMDVRMPIMDGFTATRLIREMDGEYFKNVPIIALTASTMLDIRKNIAEREFNGYLGKPFNPKELYSVLVTFSKEGKMMNSAQATPSNQSAGLQEVRRAGMIEKLEEYTEGDPTFLKEFAKNIANNIKQAKAQLVTFFDFNEEIKLDDLTHSLKPSLEIIGDLKLLDKLNEIRANESAKDLTQENKDEVLALMDADLNELNEVIADDTATELIAIK